MNIGEDPFPTVTMKYLVEDLSAHLAIMCRMYNDYDSLTRDKVERNLNSVNFSEFETWALKQFETGVERDLKGRKKSLFDIAEYERACMVAAKQLIMPLVTGRVRNLLNGFVNVTNLYRQIYVTRDIASRMR